MRIAIDAMGGDHAKTRHLLLKGRGKTTWYDMAMGDRSEAAMEEGVKHSKYILLMLTAEPATTKPPTASELEASRIFIAHRGTAAGFERAESLQARLELVARTGTVEDVPPDAKAVVCLLTSDEAPVERARRRLSTC